jgi:hypothetical protein
LGRDGADKQRLLVRVPTPVGQSKRADVETARMSRRSIALRDRDSLVFPDSLKARINQIIIDMKRRA